MASPNSAQFAPDAHWVADMWRTTGRMLPESGEVVALVEAALQAAARSEYYHRQGLLIAAAAALEALSAHAPHGLTLRPASAADGRRRVAPC